jgi:hypothetical protein
LPSALSTARLSINGCTDLEQLRDWITRAATAEKVADIFE